MEVEHVTGPNGVLAPIERFAKPTSNAIYVRLGYERVCDSRELAPFAPTDALRGGS